MLKKSFFNFEFKSVEVKNWKVKIKWFASTPDVDRYDDIVDTKAFENSIETYMKNPVILLQHDSDKPIGKCIDYKLTAEWLEITAEITENTDWVIDKLNNKVLWAFSIGFIAKKWDMVDKEINWEVRRIREIKDIDLVEISIVSTPANANAVFTITKSLKKLFDEIEKEIEESEIEVIETIETPEIEEIVPETIEIEQEVIESVVEEVIEEEKWCKKPKKPKLDKSYFEEKRVMLSWELKTWDLIRFTKCEYGCDMWGMLDMEIEVEQWEIIKIIESEDITNPTLYILEYELWLDWFVPSDEMCVIPFRSTTIEKISKAQLKEVSDELIENSNEEVNSEEAEIQPETVAEEIQAETEIETPDVEIDIEAEVEKHFEAKSIILNESFELKTKEFAESIEAKILELDAKELAIKSIYNETVELKKLTESKAEEVKQISERLLKIAVNKGVITKETPKTFNLITNTIV